MRWRHRGRPVGKHGLNYNTHIHTHLYNRYDGGTRVCILIGTHSNTYATTTRLQKTSRSHVCVCVCVVPLKPARRATGLVSGRSLGIGMRHPTPPPLPPIQDTRRRAKCVRGKSPWFSFRLDAIASATRRPLSGYHIVADRFCLLGLIIGSSVDRLRPVRAIFAAAAGGGPSSNNNYPASVSRPSSSSSSSTPIGPARDQTTSGIARNGRSFPGSLDLSNFSHVNARFANITRGLHRTRTTRRCWLLSFCYCHRRRPFLLRTRFPRRLRRRNPRAGWRARAMAVVSPKRLRARVFSCRRVPTSWWPLRRSADMQRAVQRSNRWCPAPWTNPPRPKIQALPMSFFRTVRWFP